MAELEFYIRGGSVSCIHSDEAAELLARVAGGPPATRRASHVEPNEDGTWRADLSPSGGPTLGPFPTHAAAIRAEVAWIRENVLGRPEGAAPAEDRRRNP